MSYASDVLKKISKAKDFDEVYDIVNNIGFSDPGVSFDQKLDMVTLVALADKGIKGTVSMLAQEYYNKEDFDGDGLCYGHDFIFNSSDDLPPAIRGLPNNISKTIKNISWEEYKKTH